MEVYALDCVSWNLCCCIAGDIDTGHNTFENGNLKVSDFEWALLRNLNAKMIGFTQLKGTHQELQVQNLDYAISYDPFLHSLPFFIQALASGRYPSHNVPFCAKIMHFDEKLEFQWCIEILWFRDDQWNSWTKEMLWEMVTYVFQLGYRLLNVKHS